jgi:hypothetical protein
MNPRKCFSTRLSLGEVDDTGTVDIHFAQPLILTLHDSNRQRVHYPKYSSLQRTPDFCGHAPFTTCSRLPETIGIQSNGGASDA